MASIYREGPFLLSCIRTHSHTSQIRQQQARVKQMIQSVAVIWCRKATGERRNRYFDVPFDALLKINRLEMIYRIRFAVKNWYSSEWRKWRTDIVPCKVSNWNTRINKNRAAMYRWEYTVFTANIHAWLYAENQLNWTYDSIKI